MNGKARINERARTGSCHIYIYIRKCIMERYHEQMILYSCTQNRHHHHHYKDALKEIKGDHHRRRLPHRNLCCSLQVAALLFCLCLVHAYFEQSCAIQQLKIQSRR